MIQMTSECIRMHPIAVLRCLVEDSRGRRHPEPQHPYRNDFQRDRDRVIHSRAFRRLEAKTQVFTRRYSDHFRNRLTHTLEVAQIARTVAAQLGLNVDLVEALALVHDIGHPPFGHAGEKALDSAMRQHGLSFDHNLHALRIVEDFEHRYAAFRGLNLTFRSTRGNHQALARLRCRRSIPSLLNTCSQAVRRSKPSSSTSPTKLPTPAPTSTTDTKPTCFDLEQIREGLPLFAGFLSEAEERYPDAAEKLQFNEALRRMLDRWVGRLDPEHPATDQELPDISSLEDVRACEPASPALSPEIEQERRQTKSFLYRNLYFSPALEPEKDDAERIIAELFESVDEAAGETAVKLSAKSRARAAAASDLRLHRGHDGQLYL